MVFFCRTHTLLVATLHRRNGFYTVQTVFFLSPPTPTLHLNLPLTGNFVHFYFLKKTPSELFISFCTHGDLNLVPMSLSVFRFKPPPGYINLYTQIRARSYDLKKWFLKIWQKNWKENSLSLVLAGVESAAVKDVKDRKAQGEFNTHTDTHTHTHTPNPTLFSYSIALAGASKRVFMPESDASNFFKRRGRRSPKMYEEYYGECSKTLLFSISVLLSHYLCRFNQNKETITFLILNLTIKELRINFR